ncbi:PLP-dependent aminotransferase family protein [Curvivirga sp.]|uniref:MocR-like pyridoxine biosynthesis transcription factor PdxR n=1 Tax=Curvivirga sp. TaxID=2856848 RepID=UPI003B5A4177
MRRTDKAALLPIAVDKKSSEPMHRQLYDQIRELILTHRLSAGERLPSTRSLAKDMALSRNTVATAFDQLLAEGYLEGRVGAGSFVSDLLPDEIRPSSTEHQSEETGTSRRGLSNRGERLAALWRGRSKRTPAFAPGLPAIDEFPFDVWSRLMARAWRNPPIELLAHAEPAGYRPLREAIANYLRTARAVRCEADQVIIVSGAQQGIGLAANVLLDDGDSALIEEPGYPGIRGALLAAGAQLIPVPVDEEGLEIDKAEDLAPDAKLVCVAPSHQYPLGVTMSLARRLRLLEWASQKDGWVIEDDYDSEFRYSGRPLAALQGLDRDNRVVYIGSFSKVMFPSLRLGYIVVPEDLTDSFRMARAALDDHPSTIAQPALAKFIEDGYFTAHLRRMRKLYDSRRCTLSELLEKHLGEYVTIESAEAGMHLLIRFNEKLIKMTSDMDATDRAQEKGISVTPLSAFHYLEDINDHYHGLLLGYAAVKEKDMEKAVLILKDAILAK